MGLEPWLCERHLRHRDNADVVHQELRREYGVDIGLRTVERAVSGYQPELSALGRSDLTSRHPQRRVTCMVAALRDALRAPSNCSLVLVYGQTELSALATYVGPERHPFDGPLASRLASARTPYLAARSRSSFRTARELATRESSPQPAAFQQVCGRR